MSVYVVQPEQEICCPQCLSKVNDRTSGHVESVRMVRSPRLPQLDRTHFDAMTVLKALATLLQVTCVLLVRLAKSRWQVELRVEFVMQGGLAEMAKNDYCARTGVYLM